MSLGFEQAGFDVVAAFDSEPRNVETHKKNFPRTKAFTLNLAKATGREIRRLAGVGNRTIHVLFGGPPCQGFSLIGKRDLADTRNLLLYDFARLIRELSPKYFVVENVSGLLAGDARAILKSFVRRIKRAGYAVREPVRAVCASKYGVPQKRERVFILGCKKGLQLPDYPEPKSPLSHALGDTAPLVWDAIGDLPNVDEIGYLLETDVLRRKLGRPSQYAAVLRAEVKDPEDQSRPRNGNGDGLTGCLRTLHSAATVRRFEGTLPGSSEPVSRFHRLAKHGLANTLRAGTGPTHGSHTAARPIHPVHPRCITVREAARLHSFPDWFTFHPTKWHGFRQVGNAVPPLLARAVGGVLMGALNS